MKNDDTVANTNLRLNRTPDVGYDIRDKKTTYFLKCIQNFLAKKFTCVSIGSAPPASLEAPRCKITEINPSAPRAA
jgi:hypothetical protein